MADPLTAEDRQTLEWYRDGDTRAAGIGVVLHASLKRRRLLARTVPPHGAHYRISTRGLRALRAS
jgi:uncharacterized protein YjhX (UPF0386 family)